MRKAREEREKDIDNVYDLISETYFKDINDFMFDMDCEDVLALQISQERDHDRK